MYPEKKGGSHKMARPQQNWGLLTLLTRWASIWIMPNTASPKSEPPCGRAVYTPVRATILGHHHRRLPPGGGGGGHFTWDILNNTWDIWCIGRLLIYPQRNKSEENLVHITTGTNWWIFYPCEPHIRKRRLFLSPCTALTTGNLPAVKAVRGDCQRPLKNRWKFPPVTWAHNPLRLRQSQSIFNLVNHTRVVLALWMPCLIPHWQSCSY